MRDCDCNEVETHGYKTQAGHEHGAHCVPGELCRNHYYTGKLLTARDFQMEQDYFRNKFRLHNLALHGWGIVCGLEIKAHANPDCHRFVLHPGLAIDPCGREVRVLYPREFDLPKPPRRSKGKPCSDDEQPPADGSNTTPASAAQGNKLQVPPGAEDPGTALHGGSPIEEGCEDGPLAEDLYLCLAYRECPEEFAPAPFDECHCNGPTEKPNKVCEEYELKAYSEEPEWWSKAIPEGCADTDCVALWKAGHCHYPFPIPCIPLAIIREYVPGEPLDPASIQSMSGTLLLPSASLIRQVIDCILHKLPLKDYTLIDQYNWTHGQDYSCQDFMRIFVFDQNPRSFEVRFSRSLDKDGVSKRTFVLTAVFRDYPSEPRHIQVLPTEVKLSTDRRVVEVTVDREYAQHNLERHKFDLYIRIYCDKLIDDNGDAVDGNLLARKMPDDTYMVAPPTGNGTPGGVFDSWILVR